MRQSFLQAAILAGAVFVGPGAIWQAAVHAGPPQDPYLQSVPGETSPPLASPSPYGTAPTPSSAGRVSLSDEFPMAPPASEHMRPASPRTSPVSEYGGSGSSQPMMPHQPTIDDFPAEATTIPDYVGEPMLLDSYAVPAGCCFGSALGPQSYAPNMVGDFFGVSARRSLLSVQTDSFHFAGSYRQSSTGELLYFPASLSVMPPNYVLLTTAGDLALRGDVDATIPAGTYWRSDTQHFSYVPEFALAENPTETAAVATAFPDADGVTFVSGEATRSPDDPTQFSIYTDYVIDQPSPIRSLVIPDPGAAPGAVVGRQKISDNSSPIPRSRVFVNYSFFNKAVLTPSGVDVNRVTPGFEYAFFDQNLSLEVRAPFASTLDSDVNFNGLTGTGEFEFGNVTAYLKALMSESDTFSWSAGIGMTFPTADDFVVKGDNITGLVIENEAYHVLPFIGFLWTPQERVFAQGFIQLDFDANGNPVQATSFNQGIPTGNLSTIGRASDATYTFVDLGIGYWMYRDRHYRGIINGFAPMIELHYNAATDGAETITRNDFSGMGANYQVGTPGDLETTNITFGLTAVVCESGTLTMGYSTPIAGDDQYDGQFRAFFNWYFGPQVY